MFSSRHPDELRSKTDPLGPRASVGTSKGAAEFGPIVLIAVPYDALPQIGRDFDDILNGKIVLDACNARPGKDNALTLETQANGVGPTSAKYLPGTRLVRAFSAVDATSVEASFGGKGDKLGVPLASNDAEAMKVKAEETGVITAFGKGLSLAESAGESIGIELIRAPFVDPLFDGLDAAGAAGQTDLYYEDVYSRLIAGGKVARLADVSDLRWCEIDAPEDLAQATHLFPE